MKLWLICIVPLNVPNDASNKLFCKQPPTTKTALLKIMHCLQISFIDIHVMTSLGIVEDSKAKDCYLLPGN